MTTDRCVRIGGKDLTLEGQTGTVLDSQQRSETHVHGSGRTRAGYGRTQISSSTTNHQTLFMRDVETGLEHEVRTTNFDVQCRVGHTVSVLTVWCGESGYPTHYYNHDTNRMGIDRIALKQATPTPTLAFWMIWGGVILFSSLISEDGFGVGIGVMLGFIAALLGGTMMRNARARKLERSEPMRALLEAFKARPATAPPTAVAPGGAPVTA